MSTRTIFFLSLFYSKILAMNPLSTVNLYGALSTNLFPGYKICIYIPLLLSNKSENDMGRRLPVIKNILSSYAKDDVTPFNIVTKKNKILEGLATIKEIQEYLVSETCGINRLEEFKKFEPTKIFIISNPHCKEIIDYVINNGAPFEIVGFNLFTEQNNQKKCNGTAYPFSRFKRNHNRVRNPKLISLKLPSQEKKGTTKRKAITYPAINKKAKQ